MITDSEVGVLITGTPVTGLREKFCVNENGSPLRTVLYSEESRKGGRRAAGAIQFLDAEDLVAQPTVIPRKHQRELDLAYMLYTAGSTGLVQRGDGPAQRGG